MTSERVLAVCRSNWEYRGIDDAAVRDMLAELAAHLQDAEAAGRTPREVVGEDVKAFAASWAAARRPLHRRVARLAAMIPFVAGVLLLITHLRRWTPAVDVAAGHLAFCAAIAVVTVALELRRGSLGLGRGWLVALVAGLPALVITDRLAGVEPLFGVPLGASVALVLPGLAYTVADGRARRRAAGQPDRP
ncbi:hypothetical protein [Streptomyces sp. NPDC053755]|uniref:hypothetical protein n=1 Tax=Streptomyces sp. NPDC053755 TaxID=3155815 RepID=UPI00342B9F33